MTDTAETTPAKPRPETLAETERRYILHIMLLCKGNKTRAARLLDIDRRTLYRRLAGYAQQGG